MFNRLQRFYQPFNVVATLLGSLSLAVLSFIEFHSGDGSSSLLNASAGLLVSSAITAVVAVMIATMLSFKFEGCENPRRKVFTIAWIPLLEDLVIVEFLIAVVFWYGSMYTPWRALLVGIQFAVLLAGATLRAVWMWKSMSMKGGLGKKKGESLKPGRKQTRRKKTTECY